MKEEKGITLTILIIYVVIFTIVMTLLATLSSYIYSNIGYVNDNSIDVSEFNKFNTYFIEDIKSNKQVQIKQTQENGEDILQITFEDGDTYKYIPNEKSIYKNKQKIAKNIQSFTAQKNIKEDSQNTQKYYIKVNIKIGAKDETNYEKTIDYVLKYW